MDAWKHDQRSLSCTHQQSQLPPLKQQDVPLECVYSQVLQEVLKRLERAYQNFFRRVKASQEPGFPRFKGIGRYRSLTYPQWGTGVQITGNLLVLSKIGEVPVRLHRPLEGTPKTCTITHKADGWYASIVCDLEPDPLPKTEQEVGVDVGIETFITLSGEHPSVANPRHLVKARKHLRRCQ